jgi:hypothetical protein
LLPVFRRTAAELRLRITLLLLVVLDDMSRRPALRRGA